MRTHAKNRPERIGSSRETKAPLAHSHTQERVPGEEHAGPEPEATHEAPAPPVGVRGHSFAGLPLFPSTSRGQDVPGPLRARFEGLTGQTVSGVQLHTGAASQQSAERLGARAFTVGRQVHFGEGEYRPHDAEGAHLLFHELTHTVQQASAGKAVQAQREVSEPGDAAEQEAEAVADALVVAGPEAAPLSIQERPRGLIARAPKEKKPAPPKPPTFKLFESDFTAKVDPETGTVTVIPGKKAEPWTFTQAGPNTVTAERTVERYEYVPAGGTPEPMVQRTTIRISEGTALADPIVAVLGAPPKLSIELDEGGKGKHAKARKTTTVFGASVEQLDLPAAAITFTPAEGDALHLGLGGEAYVFTALKPDPTAPETPAPPVSGFFRVGYFTRFSQRGTTYYGISSYLTSESERKAAINALKSAPAPRTLTAEEAAVYRTVTVIEHGFAGVQTYDSGVLSLGIAQWTVHSDLPRVLKKVPAKVFDQYLGRYGLAVGSPNRGSDRFVARFVPQKEREKLGVRSPSEGALFLNGKDLVPPVLIGKARTVSAELGAVEAELAAAKADLGDAAKKTAATKKLQGLHARLKGLPGFKSDKDPEKQADILIKVAQDAKAAADDLVANSTSEEVLRGEAWALRFEMLGQAPGGVDAQLAEIRETMNKVLAFEVEGATYARLAPNKRGRAALVSSYFNTQVGTRSGMKRAVESFRSRKKEEAKEAAAKAKAAKAPAPTPTEADWTAFPWPATDARWTSLYTAAVAKEFEDLAVLEVTRGTHDPDRRRKLLATVPDEP